MKLPAVLALGALALTLPAPATAQVQTPPPVQISDGSRHEKTIYETLKETKRFEVLTRLIALADLAQPLMTRGPVTIFAPTDIAFQKLAGERVDFYKNLTKDEARDLLKSILRFHIVDGKVLSRDAARLGNATTLNGQRVDLEVKFTTLLVDEAEAIVRDVTCTNGVIHAIDTVLIPETKGLLEVVAGAGRFRTLLAAAKAAGLEEELLAGGPYTLLAPTDEAFAKLPSGELQRLLKAENKKELAALLRNHLVPGRVFTDQVVKLEKARTVGDQDLPIEKERGAVTRIAGAKVLKTDLEAQNGVIHVIDQVILPKTEVPTPDEVPEKTPEKTPNETPVDKRRVGGQRRGGDPL